MRAGVRIPRTVASRMAAKINFHDLVLVALLIPPFLLLLLPFIPNPWDDATVMRIWFRGEGTRIARNFTLPVSRGACSEIQYAITDRDPKTGAYIKVGC